jgi:hypothetical protein
MLSAVYFLRWSDVAPAAHAFDPAPARAKVSALLLADEHRASPAHDQRHDHGRNDETENAIDRALLVDYGAWAAGWHWAASEPGGGGPVRGWCCARDSLFRSDDPDAMASVDRVVGALCEWRAFLEELAARFAELRELTSEVSLEEGIEYAAGTLLPLIVARTSTEDAWYSTFARVLGWYLESAGHDPAVFAGAVASVVKGRFHSWIEPDDATQGAACAELGREIARATAEGVVRPDALAAWRLVRDRAYQSAPPVQAHDPVLVDGHRRFIDTVDRARDPVRADRLLAALQACRASARRDEALTLERLAAWQSIVLGAPADLRTGDAFAKGGRERYAAGDGWRAGFEKALEEASERSTAISVRAGRVFLDVCFFHPFADGNARAARLALDHVLTRAGLGLHTVDPLFVVARAAGDPRGAWAIAHLIEHLIGPMVE